MTMPGEFDNMIILGEPRPLQAMPAPVQASNAFIREVEEALEGKTPQEQANWIANKMERYAAAFAQPVFDMEGGGPVCSFCGAYWPLCGHHHLNGMSQEEIEQQ